ncbi:MAG: heme ABC exporter ATP-binding protein CcmA [Parvularculaceae bacterium]
MAENAAPAPLLTVRDVAAQRGGRIAFSGAMLTIAPGEIYVLRGPNGAGKSTLLRLLAGRARPLKGTIAIERGDLASMTTLIGHADGIKGALTADENVLFWRDLYGADNAQVDRARSAMAIDSFRKQRAATLSAGQRRRVSLCRPIISKRPIWLFDEPTAGMDAPSVARVLAMIEAHAASGGAVVIATHEPLEIAGARQIAMAVAA